MFKNICIIVLVLLLVVVEIRQYYNNIINTYFRNNNGVIYDYFIKNYIQNVSTNNYFMNYGLWDSKKPKMKLKKANKNLCEFIFTKSKMECDSELNILDVGCGYGMQDFLLSKKISAGSKITAVDISKKQIDYANNMKRKKGVSDNKLHFTICDAHKLLSKFSGNKFNRIISLESAFHYKNRPLFFNNVSKLLTTDGVFVISDIVLNNNYKSSYATDLFIRIACDFLYVPEQNLITFKAWKKQLKTSNLTLLETYDITDKTFVPYYDFFLTNYCKNKNLPDFLKNLFQLIFTGIQPFSYVVAVCKPVPNVVPI